MFLEQHIIMISEDYVTLKSNDVENTEINYNLKHSHRKLILYWNNISKYY